jgi:tetratricopeptide (TPR) repeat protein
MLAAYTNPFDFEKPVKNPKLFAGRKETLDEIDYYLGLSQGHNPTFHNLSLIGQRAAGKSSLLNMIQYMAEKRGFLAVKISLNNETSSNEIMLFKDIIDAVMTAGAEKGMFGGIANDIYKGFRRVIDMLDAQIEIPLLIGTAHIGAKTKNTTSITQHVLTHDFKKLYSEASKQGIPAIAILLDECDLLAEHETILQKIRNVFSEIDGYVLVFSGTDKMFPAMQETFSPVPRMFKRINVENFKTIEETKECIVRRLPESEQALVGEGTVAEIHNISGGSPYEVQLISHFMYKMFKERNHRNMVIDTEVLDRLINELDRLRVGRHHEVSNLVKRLNHYQLKVLRTLIEFPNVSRELLAKAIVLSEIDQVEINDLSNQLGYYKLLIDGMIDLVLKEDDCNLRIGGDQFDMLYLRYYLIANGITEFVPGSADEPDINVAQIVTNVLLRNIPIFEQNARFDKEWSGREVDGRKAHKFIYGGKFKPKPSAKPGEWETIMSFSPGEIDKKFYLGAPNSIRVRINIDFLASGYVVQYLFDSQEDLQKFTKNLDTLTAKLGLLGLQIIRRDEVQCTMDGYTFRNQGQLAEAYRCFEEAIKLNPEYELAWANKGLAEFQEGRYTDALVSFRKWGDIRPSLGQPLEEQAKCYIHLRMNQEAFDLLEKSAKKEPDRWSAWDNRGRALRNLGRMEEAIDSFDKAIGLKSDNYDAMVLKSICLLDLGRVDESMTISETVLSQNQNHEGALHCRARALFQKGHGTEAHTLISRINDDTNVSVLTTKSLILSSLGKHRDAIECCDRIIEKLPDFPNAIYNRACFHVLDGNIDKGIEDLKRAIQLDFQLLELAKLEKDFAPIRDDERFKAVIFQSS